MKILAPTLLVMALLFPSLVMAAETSAPHLVVQQDNQALVSEVRIMELPKGAGTVVLPDLPATMDAQTLQVRSLSAPKALEIRGLVFDDEVLSPSTLLRHFVGKKVLLTLPDGKTSDGRIQKEGVVLSTEETPVFAIDGQIYSGPVDAILYPGLPQNLSARPGASCRVVNSGPARQDIALTYMAREISWRMDYVLALNKDVTYGVLSGWVTLTNHSGKDFAQANIELLAGAPHSVRTLNARGFLADAMPMAKSLSLPAQESAVYEYHIYPLKHTVDLVNQQSLRVPLFESVSIPVTRKLVGLAVALPTGRETEPVQQKLESILSFRNTATQGLGLALPQGILRALLEDNHARRFLGEAMLAPAPVGALVEARLGQAFDLLVERVVTQFEKIGKNAYRAAWELRITNAKQEPQRITLREQIPGDWKVESASQKWSKPSAGVLEFSLDVPPTGDGAPFVLRYSFTTTR
jgi:hypothetical protein